MLKKFSAIAAVIAIAGSAQARDIEIFVTGDSFAPGESSATLVDLSTNLAVPGFSGTFQNIAPNFPINEIIDLSPGNYRLTLFDDFGDGLNAPGSTQLIRVTDLVDNNDLILQNFNTPFGSQVGLSFDFEVIPAPSSAGVLALAGMAAMRRRRN